MKLTTRLLVFLVPTVAGIMMVYAAWAMVEREETLVPELRRETEAYATALALALDHALRDRPRESIQALLDEISITPTVYAIMVYDSTGVPTLRSGPLSAQTPAPGDSIARVLGGTELSFARQLDDVDVHSVLRPIRDASRRVTGVLEVTQPLTVVEAEKAKVRRRFVLNTITLLVAMILLTLVLVRRLVGDPIGRLAETVRAVGQGDLRRRVSPRPPGNELASLAAEFNNMASNLESAQGAILRQAEERVALERRMRETEKLAAIGNLAAGLAHQIAAPMSVISGRALLLRQHLPDGPEGSRHLHIITSQIDRITAIVRNLLDYARRRESRFRPGELAALVDGVLEFLETEVQRTGTTVRFERGAPATVWVDEDLMHQVLVNLVLNALQAMESAPGERLLVVSLVTETPGTVTLDLRDSGPGIPPEVLPRVFDPFVTTKARGTGLGLVVARSIVGEHGGTLDASNAPEGGAMFRLTLNLHRDPPS